ncbi:condensation domain-containing protein, partial [Polynucleobacter yangtzensis]
RVRQETAITLPLRALFEFATPAGLALQLVDGGIDESTPLVGGIGRLDGNKVTLSYGQKRLWALDRLDGASATYNIPAVFRLTGAINIEALQLALLAIIERHEALRTVMLEDEDG